MLKLPLNIEERLRLKVKLGLGMVQDGFKKKVKAKFKETKERSPGYQIHA